MSTNPQAYQRYKTMSVQTASPDRLLIMLYDGLISKAEMAKMALHDGRFEDADVQIGKCQDIVLELRKTLRMEYEISHALSSLYDWFYRQLIDARVKRAVQPIDDILPRIQELREAWVQAAIKVKTGDAAAVGSL